MVKYTRHTTLFVSDQDRALNFYEKLGLEKHDDVNGPFGRWLTVAPPGDRHEILLWPGTP
nr:VOC family protein [Haladaptatus halobius]